MNHRTRQSGLTYIEVLVATILLAIVLVPAIEALHTGLLGSRVQATILSERYSALARMESVLAEPFATLVTAAGVAGDSKTPTSYSDPAGPADRVLVYIALYDADNADGDNDVFTVPDPNFDGDNNPYTGYVGLLWIRTEVEGSVTSVETLTAL